MRPLEDVVASRKFHQHWGRIVDLHTKEFLAILASDIPVKIVGVKTLLIASNIVINFSSSFTSGSQRNSMVVW